MIITEENYLMHYGILRKSGRYPWGSGGTQSARNKTFLDTIENLRKQGMTDVEIAKSFSTPDHPFTTTMLRAANSIATNQQRQEKIGMAQKLHDKGYSNVAIGKRMGIPESSVRSLLAPGAADRADILEATSKMLKDQLEEKRYIDIGSGVENWLGLSQTRLSTAIAVLQEEGYKVHYLKVPQLGTGKNTTIKVLSKPDVPWSEINKNRDQIQHVSEFSEDGGRSYTKIAPPTSISSKRVGVRYAEEGGKEADGVIYVRPGVDDVHLGKSRYAQVRIAVDGTHYLKGMAMYKDDLPEGVDLLFNTNKHDTGNKHDAFKELKKNQDGTIDKTINTFGATISRQHGVMNIVNEEGNWEAWSKSLSTQMLSKQKPELAKGQLDMTFDRKKSEFEEIIRLTNPIVKKQLLESFADDADSSAVHLKAAALPRQGSHVILPINTLKETEIYAPNYKNGERVVLIRYPHGGTFEIPELTVNNNHRDAKAALGNARDAVGINAKVAERLSGADFDGDTVLVIPNNSGRIATTAALQGLKKFDPKTEYPAYDGMPKMTNRTKQIEMGNVSNLITDMTIKGATASEIAQAVRHSMVVIDAEKHNLDWKRSSRENGIPALKAKYQGGARAGASTLISRATSEIRVPDRKLRSAAKGGPVDPVTGQKVFEPTGESFVNKAGNVIIKTTKSTKLAETHDANALSSGTTIEQVYATHSNKLKDLANQARREALQTKGRPYSPSAKAAYSDEVASLNAKLNLALRNRPLERQAQLVGNSIYESRKAANPDADKDELKKIKFQSLEEARVRTGAKAQRIEITPKEWEAIQAGAISNHQLTEILKKADLDEVKKLATPKTPLTMTSAKKQRAQAMFNLGYTQAEVADALGVSLSTLKASVEVNGG